MPTARANQPRTAASIQASPSDDALTSLIASHGPKLYALALRLTGNTSDAQDLVQETLLKALSKRSQFRGDAMLSTWLYTIAVRTSQRMKRRRSGQPARVASLDSLMPTSAGMLADPRAASNEQRLKEHATEAVERAIPQLPDLFRLPLLLKDIAGLSLADVSRVLGIKEQTVKTRLHRGRLVLRKLIENKLPKRRIPEVAYERQVCMDLLSAKQAALDRGQDFPADDVICDRCRAVFATLDLGLDACRRLGDQMLPAKIRDQILHKVRGDSGGRAG